MKKFEIFFKFVSILSLFYFVFSSNAFALGIGSTKDFLAIGVHQLAAQKEARFDTLENGENYENVKPGLTQIYTQFNKSLGTSNTDTLYFHLGYTNLDIYKKSGDTTFDLDGLGAYAGLHFGKPVLLGLGYEAGMMKGALTSGSAGASNQYFERFDGTYSSYYYQIGFELGGDLTKAYIYFLQKLITFNTSSVDLDSINSTYDGGGISFMTSF
jgi:hypothetical protein